jgi:hypothetical protein
MRGFKRGALLAALLCSISVLEGGDGAINPPTINTAGNGIAVSAPTGASTLSTTVTVNAQSGTSYALASGDGGKLVTLNNASPVAVSIVQANTAGFGVGYGVSLFNKGAGLVTVTPTTSTINGSATLTISTNNECDIWSDGTNYFAMCTGGGSSGFPITLGSTSVASGSTNTTLTGLSIAAGGSNSIQANTVAAGGCTIGSDNLCVTGSSTVSAQANFGGSIVMTLTSGFISIGNARISLGANATRVLEFGGGDAAAPNTNTLIGQDTSVGTSNIGGGELDIDGGRGTGTGAGGAIVLGTAPAGGSGSSKNAIVNTLKIDALNHILTGGGAATAASNGTSASCTDTCNDNSGRFTLGASPNATVTVTFAKTWTAAPHCTANDETTALTMQKATASITTLTIVFSGTTTASDKITYICFGAF